MLCTMTTTIIWTEENDKIPEGRNVTFDELCVRGTLAVLVCMEMFVAALAHRGDRVFGYKRFKSEAGAVMGFGDAFRQMVLSPADLAEDMQDGIQEIGAGVVGATTETLYSGGALAMEGVDSLRRVADHGLGQLGQLGGGSVKNLTSLLAGGVNTGQQSDHSGSDSRNTDSTASNAASRTDADSLRQTSTALLATADSMFASSTATGIEDQ